MKWICIDQFSKVVPHIKLKKISVQGSDKMEAFNVGRIQRWWRKRTTIPTLTKVFRHLSSHLDEDTKQTFINKCAAIKNKCTGDGAGLTGGVLIDLLICSIFRIVPFFKEAHKGESDISILGHDISCKKITGPSDLALNWSKNKVVANQEIHFNCPIMIINLNAATWWKKNPKFIPLSNITYNNEMPSGFYLVDQQFCKYIVKLSSNNKTNSLITKEYVYVMMKRSIMLNLFISLPTNSESLHFDISKAFTNPIRNETTVD